MIGHTDITGYDESRLLKMYPRLGDEIKLARLCLLFMSGNPMYMKHRDNPGHKWDHDSEKAALRHNYSKLFGETGEICSGVKRSKYITYREFSGIGALSKHYSHMSDVFAEIFRLFSKYHGRDYIYEEDVFDALASTFGSGKETIWDDLYNMTLKIMLYCVSSKKGPSNKYGLFSRYLVKYEDAATDEIVIMLVNLFGGIGRKTNKVVAEHIYISKYPSSILFDIVEKRKSSSRRPYVAMETSSRISYRMHKYAIETFNPDYICTHPLPSMFRVFSSLELNGLIRLEWTADKDKDVSFGLPDIDVAIYDHMCEYPNRIYSVVKPEISTVNNLLAAMAAVSKAKTRSKSNSTTRSKSRSRSRSR